MDAQFKILATDIDPRAIRAAKRNAEEAGVDDCIEFEVFDVTEAGAGAPEAAAGRPAGGAADDAVDMLRGVIIGNPPYGKRIGEAEAMPSIYAALKGFLAENPAWSLFLITSDKEFEKAMGRPADRRRKLYNGDLEVCYYQYYGEK